MALIHTVNLNGFVVKLVVDDRNIDIKVYDRHAIRMGVPLVKTYVGGVSVAEGDLLTDAQILKLNPKAPVAIGEEA